jgi:LacI family transcriptional regulator
VPFYYRETLGVNGIISFAKEWGAQGMIAQIKNKRDAKKIKDPGPKRYAEPNRTM